MTDAEMAAVAKQWATEKGYAEGRSQDRQEIAMLVEAFLAGVKAERARAKTEGQ